MFFPEHKKGACDQGGMDVLFRRACHGKGGGSLTVESPGRRQGRQGEGNQVPCDGHVVGDIAKGHAW